MDQMFDDKFSTMLSEGDYYIGDVCTFLQDETKYAWLKHFKGGGGHYKNRYNKDFIVTEPAEGNGFYTGSNNFTYEIETNSIGVVHVDAGDRKHFTGGGTFHTFLEPVKVTLYDGLMAIKSGKFRLVIDTTECYSIPSDDEGYDSWS